jgi:hypothetical protein
MRKILFFLFCLFVSVNSECLAKDHSDNILSLLNLPGETVTQQKITTLLGKPASTEENNKRVRWHYTNDNAELVICWNKKTGQFENFSFKREGEVKKMCDGQLCKQLRSGITNITQAITLLGTPADMKIKGATQELHYSYQNVIMRLFFRNRILVDFTLLTQINN